MQHESAIRLVEALSNERLEAYRNRLGDQEHDNLLTHYAWNIVLCESLYPCLQMLEVVLRNRLHNRISEHFGQPNWYEDPSILRPRDRAMIGKAKDNLTKMGKPHDPGRVVAELSFGFWTSLMDRRYEQVLWPRLLADCFPHMPRTLRTRKNISKRFNAIRRLRNRVFHHEPIWHWQDLDKQHRNILEAIGWIEPAAKDFVMAIDRFPMQYRNGMAMIGNQLRQSGL